MAVAQIMSRTSPSHNHLDEDGDMSPEPQEQEQEHESHSWEFAARDEESAEIVRQLERGLPRYDGGDNRGWMEEVLGVSTLDSRTRYLMTLSCRMSWASMQKFLGC